MNSQLSTQVGHPAESVHSFAKHTEESLASYLELISHQRWLIICVALLVSLCGVLYAYLAAPQYESNLLVHVEEKGQREPKNILGEAGSMIDYKTPSAAEIELLRSRQVIARAVDRLKLYVEVKPKRLLIRIEGITLFLATQGIDGSEARDLTVLDTHIIHSEEDAVLIGGVGTRISRIKVDGTVQNGLRATDDARDVRIEDSVIRDTGMLGMPKRSKGAIIFEQARGHVIERNTIQRAAYVGISKLSKLRYGLALSPSNQ